MSGALVARSRQLRYMFDRKTCLSLDELLCLGPCWSLNKTFCAASLSRSVDDALKQSSFIYLQQY